MDSFPNGPVSNFHVPDKLVTVLIGNTKDVEVGYLDVA